MNTRGKRNLRRDGVLAALAAVLGLSLAGCGLSTQALAPQALNPLHGGTCGPQGDTTLWAGMTQNVGQVLVTNDGVNLYVRYIVDAPWTLREAHLDIEAVPFTERGAPGQYPYHSLDGYFVIPQTDLPWVSCGVTLYLRAHAALERYDAAGNLISETAYAGTITKPRKGSWYGNLAYIWCCNGGGEQGETWVDETAWAAGTRYVQKGNWATYTAYEGAYKSVTLYAGQTLAAGTVEFSAPVGGQVAITITLNSGWRFAPDKPENVKIQDYATAPSGNPSPGLFAWKGQATGSSFSITVRQNNFYGVHVDVERQVP